MSAALDAARMTRATEGEGQLPLDASSPPLDSSWLAAWNAHGIDVAAEVQRELGPDVTVDYEPWIQPA